jgi:UPF0755 protein
MPRSWVALAAAAGALAAGIAVATLLWANGELHRPWAGWDGDAVDVVIPQGLAASTTLERLAEAGVVRRPGLAGLWLSWKGWTDALQAGEYRFSEPESAIEVLGRLRSGDVLLHRVTVPEGLLLEEVARRIADAGFASYESLIGEFKNPDPILSIDPAAEDLEGYLFPETYSFPRDEPAPGIARAMVRNFLDVTGPEFAERAANAGLTAREAVTLASLIEKETSVAGERARISAVFHNRLARGMALQCDPTVIYAHHRAGRTVERLTYADLEFDSPWNTYRVAGLPPGPIANPGQASLDAAVAPIESDEFYFVASPEGGHQFSRDLDAHTRAVRVWRDYVRSSR